jgi:hypothetical protein
VIRTNGMEFTFSDDQEVSRADVFRVRPPDGWRVTFRDGGQCQRGAARGPYGIQSGTFTSVEFAAVTTMAMRLEARMTADATVSIAEWRVGGEAQIAPPVDLQVSQSFALDGDVLDWTIALRKPSSSAPAKLVPRLIAADTAHTARRVESAEDSPRCCPRS